MSQLHSNLDIFLNNESKFCPILATNSEHYSFVCKVNQKYDYIEQLLFLSGLFQVSTNHRLHKRTKISIREIKGHKYHKEETTLLFGEQAIVSIHSTTSITIKLDNFYMNKLIEKQTNLLQTLHQSKNHKWSRYDLTELFLSGDNSIGSVKISRDKIRDWFQYELQW